jgi:uncharacterized peroxidase-related enzyme
MAFIETIKYENSSGRLKEIYDSLISKRGKLADVHIIQSLNPETIVLHMDLYMGIMFGASPLSRPQREMIAVIVSKYNNCDYCINHHSVALMNFWKDESKVQQLIDDYNLVDISVKDKVLCEFAKFQTLEPQKNIILIRKLKDAGFDERAILDAVLVVAYFNFVNRIVLSLGLELKEEETIGYKYGE